MKRYPRPGWVRILPTMPLKKLFNYNSKIHTEDEELVTTYWDEHEEELAQICDKPNPVPLKNSDKFSRDGIIKG